MSISRQPRGESNASKRVTRPGGAANRMIQRLQHNVRRAARWFRLSILARHAIIGASTIRITLWPYPLRQADGGAAFLFPRRRGMVMA
jgi:hypothetical protein